MEPDQHFKELMERAPKKYFLRDLLERIAAKLRVAWALHALTGRTMRDEVENREEDLEERLKYYSNRE